MCKVFFTANSGNGGDSPQDIENKCFEILLFWDKLWKIDKRKGGFWGFSTTLGGEIHRSS
jgi:hypothetical protein